MRHTRGFKGIWIPSHLWELETLKFVEKGVIAEVESLDDGDGCWASNSHLASFLNVTPKTITRILASLKERGYLEDVGTPEKRALKTTAKCGYSGNVNPGTKCPTPGTICPTPLDKMSHPPGQNVPQDNNREYNRDSIQDKSGNGNGRAVSSSEMKKEGELEMKNAAISFYKNLCMGSEYVYSSKDERKFASSLYSKELKEMAVEFGYASASSFVKDVWTYGNSDRFFGPNLSSIPGWATTWRKVVNRMIADGKLKKRKSATEEDAKILEAIKAFKS